MGHVWSTGFSFRNMYVCCLQYCATWYRASQTDYGVSRETEEKRALRHNLEEKTFFLLDERMARQQNQSIMACKKDCITQQCRHCWTSRDLVWQMIPPHSEYPRRFQRQLFSVSWCFFRFLSHCFVSHWIWVVSLRILVFNFLPSRLFFILFVLSAIGFQRFVWRISWRAEMEADVIFSKQCLCKLYWLIKTR